ncbi:MAG: hypothetical protein AB1791_23640 [Chloroflexota bacterium]
MITTLRARGWLVLTAILALTVVVLAAGRPAFAHEGREVGEYVFVVGFLNEPAIEGEKNAASLRVSHHDNEDEGVEGLEETLQLEVTHVDSGVSRTFALESVFEDPGHYKADFIPTAPGAYRFRFFGAVGEAAVDETFESGEGTFSFVETAADLQFPVAVAQMREVEGAARGAQDVALQAQAAVQSTTTLATIGLILGGLGVVLGLVALFRKK